MYGSDWSMIGQEEGPDRYPGAVTAALQQVWPGELAEDLRWRNAASYLGLGGEDATRSRLKVFYDANGLKMTALDRFRPDA
jgi:hypothetical protein